MSQWYYLIALIISLAGIATLDYRYRLAFWADRRRTLLTLGTGVLVFVLWDMLGIALGIFFHGNSMYALPFRLAPEFPIEELFFLTLLCYSSLLIYLTGVRRWPRT